MALSGKLLTDFSSFFEACSKAEGSLTSFQSKSANVESSLKRMEDSFSGVKLIQQAGLMSEAFERLNKQGIGLTSDELQRMGKTADEAITKLKAIGEKVPEGIQRISDEAAKARKETQSWTEEFTGGIGHMAAGFITAEAVIGAFEKSYEAVVDFIKESIHAYAEAETNISHLTVALRNQGGATPELVASYRELSHELQNTSTFSKEAMTSAMAMFIQVGNVGPDMMERATRAAADLSSGLGVDLERAVMLLSKAAEGNTTALRRYGIILDDAKAKSEGFTYVLDEINKRVGGQSQAELDTYAGKIKHLGNVWEEVKESVGKMIVEDANFQASLHAIEAAVEKINGEAEHGTASMSEWWDMATGNVQMLLVNRNMREVAALARDVNNELKLLGKPPEAKGFSEALEQGRDLFKELKELSDKTFESTTKGWKDSTTEAKKYKDAADAAFKKFSGEGAAEQMKILDATFVQLADSGKLTRQQFDDISEEAKKLADDGAKLTERLAPVVAMQAELAHATHLAAIAHEHATEKLDEQTKALERFNTAAGKYIANLPKAIFETRDMPTSAPQVDTQAVAEAAAARMKALAGDTYDHIEGRMRKLGVLSRDELKKMADVAYEQYQSMRASGEFNIGQLDDAWARYEAAVDKANGATKRVETSLSDLASAFARVAQISDGSFGTVAKWLGTIVSSMDLASKSGVAFRDAFDEESLGDKMTGIATGIMGVVAALDQATASGNRAQKVLGGAVAGAEAGSAFGQWGTAIGAGVGALVGAFRKSSAGRNQIVDFAEEQGGFDALHAKLDEVGAAGEAMWVRLTQNTKASDTKAAAAAIADVNKMLADQVKLTDDATKETTAYNASLSGIIKSAGSFRALPEEMQPWIDQLEKAGRLSKENADALRSMGTAGATSFDHMTELAKKYGIEEAGLGKAFQQNKTTAAATDMINAFEELIAGGADYNAVLVGMQDEMSTLAQNSIKFGTEIPGNMKPWIEQLAKEGRLLDENGKKIDDTSKIKFGESIKPGLEDVVKKLQEMIDLMTKGLPNALTGLAGRTFPTVRVPVDFIPGGGRPPGTVPGGGTDDGAATGGFVGMFGIQHFARGGRAIGTDTVPAMLTPGEIILNAAQQTRLAQALTAAAALGSRPGGGGDMRISLEAEGMTLAEIVVPYIPGVAKRYRLTN